MVIRIRNDDLLNRSRGAYAKTRFAKDPVPLFPFRSDYKA